MFQGNENNFVLEKLFMSSLAENILEIQPGISEMGLWRISVTQKVNSSLGKSLVHYFSASNA